MKELTIIIPIIELTNEEEKNLFERAYRSALIQTDKIFIVGSKEALKTLPEGTSDAKLIDSGEKTSYSEQVMLGVAEVKTDYFSILEFDDRFGETWSERVEEFITQDKNDTFAILPLTEVVDYRTNETISYANEAVWAVSFAEEVGFYDLESLENYFNYNMSGAVLKTKDFIKLGGLKTSMKLVHWYEFLFRALYNQKRVYVLPKIGCFHTANRPGCLTETYMKMTEEEVDWWINLAKTEYMFPHDRNKTFE